jgi:hypothetical protein
MAAKSSLWRGRSNASYICKVGGEHKAFPRECVLHRAIPAIEASSTRGLTPLAAGQVQIEVGAKVLICGAGFDEHTMRVLWKKSYYFVYAEDLQMGLQHFSSDEWYGFLFGEMTSGQKELMQGHLDGACCECLESSVIWHEVYQACQQEARFQPPPATVQAAVDLCFSERIRNWLPDIAEFARLVFDSSRNAIAANVRGPAVSGRHMLHETSTFAIDLRMEDDPGGKRIRLTGQVLNKVEPSKRPQVSQVVLFRGDSVALATRSNPSGEFELNFDHEIGLNLFITIGGYQAIGIRLPD